MVVRSTIRHSYWIMWKDLLEFSRSRMRLAMLVLMPLLMMGMVGFIYPSSSTIQDQPIAIADLDTGVGNASFSHIFTAQLEAINHQTGMMVLSKASGFDDIKTKIQDGKLAGGIIIPADFTARIIAGTQGNITVVTDTSNPQTSAMIQGVLSKTISSMGTMLANQTLNQTYHIDSTKTVAIMQPYYVKFGSIVPGKPNYFEFVAPGIMSMVVMMSLMTGLPHAISYEKDIGTLDGMLVAPINRLSIILGKSMAQTVRGMVQGFIILGLSVVLFGVVIHGSVLLVILLILLVVFSFVGLGILITSFTENEETAAMVMMTFMFPMMFMSGVFFPVDQMPGFMQGVAHVLPLTYASQAMRKVMLLGAGLSAIYTEIIILTTFGVVLLIIAVPMFKRAMSR
jgi:ABC-2 type transport system permease protein